MAQWYVFGHGDPKELGIVGLPGWSGDLQHSGIVHRRVTRIKVRVLPNGTQFRRPDVVQIGGVLFVNGIADRRFAAAIFSDFASTGDRHIVDPFMPLALLVDPTFDDLDAVQIARPWVLQGTNHKHWGLLACGGLFRRLRKIPAHRHPTAVANGHGIGPVDIVGVEIPATEESHHHAGSGGRVRFLLEHGVKEGLAGVFPGPDGRQPGGQRLGLVSRQLVIPAQGFDHIMFVAISRRLTRGNLAPKILLTCRSQRSVGICAADHPELERIGSQLVLLLKPNLQSRTGVLIGQHRIFFGFEPGNVAFIPGPVVGKLICR